MLLISVINFSTIAIALYFAKYPKNYNFLHPKKMFIYFFLLVQVSGYFFAMLISVVDGEYKISNASMINASILTLYGLIIFIISYYVLSQKHINYVVSKFIRIPEFNEKFFQRLFIVFLSIGVIGLSIYFMKNGFVFLKEGGYENRNESNLGMGYAKIMFEIGFRYALASFLLFRFTKMRFVLSLIATLIVGILVFLIIGGGRTGALSLFVTTILIALYYDKTQSRKKILLLGTTFFFIITILTVIRYKYEFSTDNIVLLLYQIQGSFSPIDSFSTIVEVMPKEFDFRADLMFNSFLTLVPRFIWVDKPIEILVASVFFTNEILNYGSFVTISPTLLGELYIYNGLFGITFGMMIVAFFIRLLSIVYLKSHRTAGMRLFIVFKLYIAFGLMRDGVSIFARDLFFSFGIFIFLVISIFILHRIVTK